MAWSYDYNNVEDVLSITDPLNNVIRLTWGCDGKNTVVQDAAGNVMLLAQTETPQFADMMRYDTYISAANLKKTVSPKGMRFLFLLPHSQTCSHLAH